MTTKIPPNTIYVRSMGKALEVTAIITTEDEANAHMERHDNDTVVACFGSLTHAPARHPHGFHATYVCDSLISHLAGGLAPHRRIRQASPADKRAARCGA